MRPAYNFSSFSIDINLLQKREDKFSLPIVPILLILLAMGGALGFGWLWYDAQEKLTLAQTNLDTVNTKMATIESGFKQNNFTGQVSDVLNQPTLLKESKPVTTKLLSQLNKLLPQYANVTQLDLNETGTMNITLYFATSEDIISFSQAIQSSENFKLVKMGTITNVTNQFVAAAADADSDSAIQPPPKPAVSTTTTLPVYQTTFELKYERDSKGS